MPSNPDGSRNPEGHSVAAWIAVAIIAAGFVLGGVALVIGQWWLFWTGVALAVVGGIVGKVLSLMGLGNEPA